ncbi:uncharacterized protein LOC106160214 [Lingula anatina]|uniref:Annexin n=1 Tax=Lingula anatina TaxID=7574 RepID=A0A1S3I1R2_LINAN|nr:uncharacterized protein LOC106160214 [Lingula anatina]|eukprot:XP_013392205.1 uncharacterized protein LOC106160214 [Lingula anatina]
MPSAGAIGIPSIIPLRDPIPGKPSNHIDIATCIELNCSTSGCKLYFTTDGSRPDPFQRKSSVGQTFKYRGPFTLKPGKRLLKVIAIARDGLHESAVVTKTFQVDDFDSSDYSDFDDSSTIISTSTDTSRFTNRTTDTERSVPKKKKKDKKDKKDKEKKDKKPTTPRKAWENGDMRPVSAPPDMDGPFNPVNYSGTQVNVWGVPPDQASNIAANPRPWVPGPNPSPPPWASSTGNQYGYYTNQMMGNLYPNRGPMVAEMLTQKLDETRQKTVAEVRQALQTTPPKPAIEYPVKTVPDANPCSPGNGNWREQIEHIYAHLLELAKNNPDFKETIAEPKMGRVIGADFEEDDDSYILTVSLAKYGVPKKKKTAPVPKTQQPKTQQPQKPPPQKTAPAKKPAEAAKTVAAATKWASKKGEGAPPPMKLKPKPEPEAEPEPKGPEPYFETEEYEQEGTLKPYEGFNVQQDCEVLRKAMKGLGTDEKAIIQVMGYRTSTQRQDIVRQFKTMFGKDLISEFKGELSGNFYKAIHALCLAPADYDAYELQRAVKGLGTDDDCLIEIICTRTNAQIAAIKEAYKRLFNKELEKAIMDDTSGHFKRLLVSLLQGNRDESSTFDRTQAQQDAQLKVYSLIYESLYFNKNYDNISYFSTVKSIKNKPAMFALKLHKAMKGLGTDDDALVRIVVTRCEVDMVQIKEAFMAMYNQTLGKWIADDISGDYRQLILALVNEEGAARK